ncbi:hypothetical protein TruAng_002288 [Truncatella angustata]|nr:hypothetical protein TruAng_002288 [Truncatella angustata]
MQNAGCPPSYAILSHTWGNGEVSLQQYQIWRGLLTDPFFDNDSSIEDEISSGGFIIHGLDDAWESRIDEQIKGATKIAQGLVKILCFAKEVFIAGHDSYIWVETCCIDKTSSAELQEAINSMFGWYAGASICYDYLSDINAQDPEHCELHKSKWFRRGWTLQELLAPSSVVF